MPCLASVSCSLLVTFLFLGGKDAGHLARLQGDVYVNSYWRVLGVRLFDSPIGVLSQRAYLHERQEFHMF